MGHRSADAYAADAAEHARFMRAVDPSLKFIAVGKTDDRDGWTETVLGAVGNLIDYLSFHLYGATTQLIDGEAEYDAIVAQSLYFEQQIVEYSGPGRRNRGEQRRMSALWRSRSTSGTSGTSSPRPGRSRSRRTTAERSPREVDGLPTHPAHRVNRWSPRTLADALFYAGVFHALHRAAGREVPVTMANTVNLLNANGVIVARPGGAVRAATYHVWDLYQNHLGPIALAADVRSPGRLTAVRQGDERDHRGEFRAYPATVPDLDVSATETADGRSIRIAVINRHRDTAIRAGLTLDTSRDALPTRAAVKQLTADDILASNSLTGPDAVSLRDLGTVELTDASYDFPPHSITLLSFDLS